jgi:hypothetical protein
MVVAHVFRMIPKPCLISTLGAGGTPKSDDWQSKLLLFTEWWRRTIWFRALSKTESCNSYIHLADEDVAVCWRRKQECSERAPDPQHQLTVQKFWGSACEDDPNPSESHLMYGRINWLTASLAWEWHVSIAPNAYCRGAHYDLYSPIVTSQLNCLPSHWSRIT